MNLQILKNDLNNKIEIILDKLEIEYEVFGDNIYSTCPAHEDSDNPRAFSFSKNKGIWNCWTRSCQEHYNNDIFGMIRGALSNKYGKEFTFSETLKWIHKNVNTKNIPTQTNIQKDEIDIITTLKDNIKQITHSPIKIENTNIPSKYFISRGFKSETLKEFAVGDCDNLSSKMYNRAVIPIHDDEGENIIATIGRSTKEYKIPKFLIYPKGVSKSNILYNFHRAKSNIYNNSLIIVEGQGDVWRLYESGILNCVSIFGKSLSCLQIKKIQKLPITNIVVLTDNDQAGKEAKVQIQRDLGRMYNLFFPRISTKDIGEMSIEQVKTQIVPQIERFIK